MLRAMKLRWLVASLAVFGSAAPYAAPVLCTLLTRHASQMASCPDKPDPVPAGPRQGCSLVLCAAVPIAALPSSSGFSPILAVIDQPHVPPAEPFDGATLSPLTPPPIA